tara:strand:- start:127 stop:816 length:690 start_codon:yes stop_codon:yes gene_type:complete
MTTSMPWFRMYHEFATDPKVQMLSEVDQRRFIMLLCLKCCNGDVTLQCNEIAFQLRVTEAEWQATKARLIDKGLIDEDGKPEAWDKRQYVSDSSAERVRKHRENKKRYSNVTETKCNAVDTDTDTDTDKKEGDKPPVKAKRFSPPANSDVMNYLVQQGLQFGNAGNEADKYCDFYESKNWHVGKNKMKDWKSAARNWIRRINENEKSKRDIAPSASDRITAALKSRGLQ